ncbi:MAG: DUF3784 domain-containing protein [Bacteroidales bacterium]|nr:DUF3784 domain-containing protein [Bacteroidales bacterium]
MLITLVVIASLCACIGIVILLGKGDKLISGYNMASEEEKARYDVRRLRLVCGILLLALVPLMLLFLLKPGQVLAITLTVLMIALCTAAVILMNTWAKRKE